jgi:tyrosyl-tRNA synthetase
MKASDEDVGRYLKLFTLLPMEQIEQVLEDHSVSCKQDITTRAQGSHLEKTRRARRTEASC